MIEANTDLPTVGNSKLVLFLGPSGAGKTTIMEVLFRLDRRFRPVIPLTTRKLREGETTKTHVSFTELAALDRAGELMTRNHVFGYEYATLRRLIEDPLKKGLFPCLDWPVALVPIITAKSPYEIFTVYVAPPSLEVLRCRLQTDNRDPTGERWVEAQRELAALGVGEYDAQIDLMLINRNGRAVDLANEICSKFLTRPGPLRRPAFYSDHLKATAK